MQTKTLGKNQRRVLEIAAEDFNHQVTVHRTLSGGLYYSAVVLAAVAFLTEITDERDASDDLRSFQITPAGYEALGVQPPAANADDGSGEAT